MTVVTTQTQCGLGTSNTTELFRRVCRFPDDARFNLKASSEIQMLAHQYDITLPQLEVLKFKPWLAPLSVSKFMSEITFESHDLFGEGKQRVKTCKGI